MKKHINNTLITAGAFALATMYAGGGIFAFIMLTHGTRLTAISGNAAAVSIAAAAAAGLLLIAICKTLLNINKRG